MGKIISITNQKGGVGKTTTAVNLAAALGAKGKSVLLVDIDPQGNATSGVGINKRSIKASSYTLLMGLSSANDTILATRYQGLSLIPSDINLAGAEIELVSMEDRQYRLKNALIEKRDSYDFILIDNPPSLGLLTINGLTACDTILIPIQTEYYALEGLAQLMATVRQVKRLYNPGLELEGVLLTMFDSRLSLSMQVMTEVKRFFPQKVYSTAIPRNVRVSEAPGHGKPIKYYDPTSRGAISFDLLADEVIADNMPAEAQADD
ncbi:MAG: ParA family protein [Oscillospiraceae bacterium]